MKYLCRPQYTSVAMGIVDEGSVKGGEVPKPSKHIFLGEKAGWWEVGEGDGAERYEVCDEPFLEVLSKWEKDGCPARDDVG